MAINPELITTIRVDQLPDGTLNLTNKIPHTSGTVLEKASVQELVDLVATAIGVSGGVGYIALSVTDGQQLPDVPELPSFFLCGAGTFLNINGYPNIICTENLNAIMSLTDHWELAVEIPINPLSGTVQSVTGSAVDNTDPLNPVINEIIYGVQNIVAGTNITVDNTDPANPIVSATGGTGTPTLQEVTDEGADAYGNTINLKNSISSDSLIQFNVDDAFEPYIKVENLAAGSAGHSTILGSSTIEFEGNGDYNTIIEAGVGVDNIVTLPSESGTLALTTDITTPTLQEVTDEGATTTNPISIPQLNLYDTAQDEYSKVSVTDRIFNVFTPTDDIIFSADILGQINWTNEDGFVENLKTTNLTATRYHELPDADGTLALTSDIPAAIVTSVGLTMPSAFSVTNSPITSSGDIAVTGAGLVSQYVRGDGTLANFPNSTGGGSSVNYYLNGSVSQGTFGGDTYYQMSKTPILGAGTNFTRTNGAGNGYIASFITDAGDPSFLNIPGGNWNVEFYFQSSATGGSPQFYGEIYKVSATNVFTLVASGSANPEGITNGTTVDQYFTSIPVPQTSLLITDRLAVRIYVITSGRTITLHTENGNLCEILTTFTTGLTALNGLTQQVQNLAVGTSGTDFAISSATDTHTFNLPTASATNRGALSSADWSIFNGKQNVVSGVSDTEIGYLNGVTSAIQTQLNTKCQSIYNLTSQVTHTGTTAKTIILSFLIPANTFTDGDFLNFSAIVAKTSVTSTTHNLEINTTNTLTGATTIAIAGFSSTNATMKFKREIVLSGGSAYVLNVSAGTPNDSIVGVNVTPLNQYTYNLAADLYFFITCTLTNTTDSITYRGVSVTKN
jgi:hypothetical protein